MSTGSSPRLSRERYLTELGTNVARARQVLATVPPDARVPTCPQWTAADLLAHLPESPSDDSAGGPDADSPTTPVGGPAPATESAVGPELRRRAHEACLHRLDAELTAQAAGGTEAGLALSPTPIDVALADDGVDEVLRQVHGHTPDGGDLTPLAQEWIRVVATDTGSTWLVRPAERTVPGGSRPAIALEVAGEDHADGTRTPRAIVSATTEDLYRWLWGRPPVTPPQHSGAAHLLEHLDAVVGLGVRHPPRAS